MGNAIVPFENTDDDYSDEARFWYGMWATTGNELEDVGNGIKNLFRGLWDATVDLLDGVFSLALFLVIDGCVPDTERALLPDWMEERVTGMKDGIKAIITDPVAVVEAMGQSMTDTYEEEGLAYAVGYISLDVIAEIAATKGAGGAKGAAKAADTAADAASAAKKLDTVADAAGAAKKVDTVADAAGAAKKVDTVTDAAKAADKATDAARAADKVSDAAGAAKKVDRVTDAAKTADKATDAARAADKVSDVVGATKKVDTVTNAASTAKKVDTVTDAASTAKKVDTVTDAASTAKKVDTVTDAAGAAKKVDTVTDAAGAAKKADTATDAARTADGLEVKGGTAEVEAIPEVNPVVDGGTGAIHNISELSNEQIEALIKYTGDDYANINNSLRGMETLTPENRATVEAMKSALDNSALPQDMTLYRGTSTEALGSLQNLSVDELVGKTFTEQGFMSTSTSNVVAEGFSGNMQMIIEASKGAQALDISSISQYTTEAEVLFNTGQEMLITSAEVKNGILHITVIIE